MFGPSNTPAPPPGADAAGKPGAAPQAPPPPASDLAYFLQRLATLEDPRVNYALTAIVLLIAGWFGWKLWTAREASRLASAWGNAINVPLAVGADNTSDPVATLQTMLAEQSNPALQGAIRLRTAVALVERSLAPGATREPLLEQAESELRNVLADSRVPATIAAPAVDLLATVQESRRNFDAAKTTLEMLSDPRYAGSPFQFSAKSRLSGLTELARPVQFTPGTAPPPVGPPAPDPTASAPTTSAPTASAAAPIAASAPAKSSASAPAAPGAGAPPASKPAAP